MPEKGQTPPSTFAPLLPHAAQIMLAAAAEPNGWTAAENSGPAPAAAPGPGDMSNSAERLQTPPTSNAAVSAAAQQATPEGLFESADHVAKHLAQNEDRIG